MALGAWRLSVLPDAVAARSVQYAVAGGCCWPSGCGLRFRLVNMPRFADFLIAVEAEMNKVSWPSRGELIRSSIVVLITIVLLTVVLFAYDMFWGVDCCGRWTSCRADNGWRPAGDVELTSLRRKS